MYALGRASSTSLQCMRSSAGTRMACGSTLDDGHVTEVDLSVWHRTMNLNVLGTILSCRHAIPEIIKAGGGSVVNMSSGAALRA